jgi:hypothetical protein
MYEWNVCRLSCLNLCSWLARSPSIGDSIVFESEGGVVIVKFRPGAKVVPFLSIRSCICICTVLTFAISIRCQILRCVSLVKSYMYIHVEHTFMTYN